MPHSMRAFVVIWMFIGGALASPAVRGEENISFPRGTKFILQLDLERLQDTQLGRWLFDFARQKITEELAQQVEGGEGPSLEKINEVLGFDPFQEVQQITLAAGDYEHPERSLCAIVHMRETTGNLEGLMLALPDYEASEYRGHRIHSAAHGRGDEMHVFAAIHEATSRGKRLVVAPDRSTLEMMLDQMDSRRRTRHDDEATSVPAGDAILNLQVVDIPTEMIDDGPHANIARILKRLNLQISAAKDDLEVVISIAAQTEEQSDQLRQMTQGLLAMLELAQSMEPENVELQTVMELIHDLDTRQDGDATQIAMRLNSDMLIELIESELD